jgi:predicted naringenin-chalcone synthase
VFYWYLLGLMLLALWSFLPSEVHTEYSVRAAALSGVLLGGLYFRSRACRMVLIGIGCLAALSGIALQDAPLELVATIWSALAACVTALLLSPTMRRYTN